MVLRRYLVDEGTRPSARMDIISYGWTDRELCVCVCVCVRVCVCRVGMPLEHKDRHRWGRAPRRPACIGGKSGSSLVWQPMDLTEQAAAA